MGKLTNKQVKKQPQNAVIGKKKIRTTNKDKLIVNKDTLLGYLMQFPDVVEVLYKNGVPCIACPMVGFEANFLTIGQVAETYGLDLDKILTEVDAVLQKLDKDNKRSW